MTRKRSSKQRNGHNTSYWGKIHRSHLEKKPAQSNDKALFGGSSHRKSKGIQTHTDMEFNFFKS